jgi:hypothetical protein
MYIPELRFMQRVFAFMAGICTLQGLMFQFLISQRMGLQMWIFGAQLKQCA